MGASKATMKYSPEFTSNLLTRLNSTVGKNPAILQPFLKYFSSYYPQMVETPIFPPYAMPRPLPIANDFLMPFSSYCRQPYLHQKDITYRQAGLSQYQAANALPTHSLIEHIAQTTVQPINLQPNHLVGSYGIPYKAIETPLIQAAAAAVPAQPTATINTNLSASKAVSMIEKNPNALTKVTNIPIAQPITIQDLIASLLEQPNNVHLQQQAQPFLQALINQYHTSAVQQLDTQSIYQPLHVGKHGKEQLQINTEPIYYHIKPTASNVIEKSVAVSQSFKPYKKTEAQFQPIQKPAMNVVSQEQQKTVSMVQQQNQPQLQTPMPTAYSSTYEPQGHVMQNQFYMPNTQTRMQFGNSMHLNAYDPNVQLLANHFHGLNTF